MQKLINIIVSIKDSSKYLNYGRELITKWVERFSNNRSEILKILDIGCGRGFDLMNIKENLQEKNIRTELYGIEIYEEYIKESESHGITVSSLNLETDSMPYLEESFDIIIINQVLEHVKEFFWIVSEINRVLKKGGLLIIGVPNLASWHNRLLLMFGQQPTSIRVLGPHVRGFTKSDLNKTMTRYGGFSLYASGGSNFYPFPAFISNILSKIFPSGSVSLFCAFKKIERSTFKEFLSARLETNFKIPEY